MPRHHDIEQHAVDPLPLQGGQRFAAIAGGDDGVALGAQEIAHQQDNLGFVVYHKDGGAVIGHLSSHLAANSASIAIIRGEIALSKVNWAI